MRRLLSAALFSLSTVLPLAASAQEVEPANVVAAAVRPLAFDGKSISGPGADFLRAETRDSQFVLLGEYHFDHDTPGLARALYDLIRKSHGFDTLVVENDPLAMEAVERSDGDLDDLVALVRRYPTHIGFSSDQDLLLYAHVAKVGRLLGVEQAQGATRYLEELVSLAPNAAARRAAAELLAVARVQEVRSTPGRFLHDDPDRLSQFEALRAGFDPKPGSRAERLIEALITSARIYGYNRRAGKGEPVGLFNNTEREYLFKRQFMAYYRPAARVRPFKAMFKMGLWHMYRGKSPGQAYTIGNFAHEFAIANGKEAFGVAVIPTGEYSEYSKLPIWLKPILPTVEPAEPVVIDLASIKPIVGRLSAQVPEGVRWQLRDFVHGFDAVVLLPASRKATTELTAPVAG